MSDLLLIVTIADRKVGIRAAEVNSVIALDNVTPVPRVPDYIPGLTALRSRALTVIDCARSLELAEPVALEAIASRNAAVVEHDGHLYALLVDDVFDVMQARSQPTPVPGKLAAGWKRCAIGLVETDDVPVLLLDLGQVVAGPLEQAA